MRTHAHAPVQREVDIATGRVLREARLDAQHFGEGTTVFGGKVGAPSPAHTHTPFRAR
jgi:glutamine cyclotransferase